MLQNQIDVTCYRAFILPHCGLEKLHFISQAFLLPLHAACCRAALLRKLQFTTALEKAELCASFAEQLTTSMPHSTPQELLQSILVELLQSVLVEALQSTLVELLQSILVELLQSILVVGIAGTATEHAGGTATEHAAGTSTEHAIQHLMEICSGNAEPC